jgi:hypothetical protein
MLHFLVVPGFYYIKSGHKLTFDQLSGHAMYMIASGLAFHQDNYSEQFNPFENRIASNLEGRRPCSRIDLHILSNLSSIIHHTFPRSV